MKLGLKYALIVFAVWVSSPLLLGALVYLINSALLDPSFIFFLFIPAIILSLITYFLSTIKSSALRTGIFYSIVGVLIWVSPALYFLRTSDFYISHNTITKSLLILIPSIILAALFFYIGKYKVELESSDISDLYLKRNKYKSTPE